MRMKYYLRGLGVGFIVSALIFIVAFAFYKPSLSKEELISQAKKQGLVIREAEGSGNTISDSKKEQEEKEKAENKEEDSESKSDTESKETDSKDDSGSETEKTDEATDDGTVTDENGNKTTTTENPDGTTTTVTSVDPKNVVQNNRRIEIRPGTSDSLKVANDLASMGVVDDGKKFDDFMNANNYSRRIQPGIFEFHTGMTYEEVAKVLTKSK